MTRTTSSLSCLCLGCGLFACAAAFHSPSLTHRGGLSSFAHRGLPSPTPRPPVRHRFARQSSARSVFVPSASLVDANALCYTAWEWCSNLGAPAALVGGAALASYYEMTSRGALEPRTSDARGARLAKKIVTLLLLSSFAFSISNIFVTTVTGTVLMANADLGALSVPNTVLSQSSIGVLHKKYEFEVDRSPSAHARVDRTLTHSHSHTIVVTHSEATAAHAAGERRPTTTTPSRARDGRRRALQFLLARISFLQGLLNWIAGLAIELAIPKPSESRVTRKLSQAAAAGLSTMLLLMLSFYNDHDVFHSDYGGMLRRFAELSIARFVRFPPGILPALALVPLCATVVLLVSAFRTPPDDDGGGAVAAA